jgi:uncharacterized lipoprotein YmbA
MCPVVWRLTLMPLMASFLGLGACANPSARFYLLTTQATSETSSPPEAGPGPVIGVGPVTLPKYLERPQIVTRVDQNRLAVGELERWAEPLRDNITRVLGEHLALLVPTDQVWLQPWPRSAALDYQVTIDVLQFDGRLGGETTLLAFWRILDGAEVPLLSHRTSLRVLVGGADYDAIVVAMNQLLAGLSHDMAVAIRRLASRVVVGD